MSNVAQAPAGSGEAYRVLRELGARSRRTFAAIREPHELVVLQRFVRTPATSSSLPPAQGEHAHRAETPARSGTMSAALPPESATTATAEELALLLRDAHCVAKHWHPNVARVRHVAVVGTDLLVASELVDGVTLEDLRTAGEARGKAERERLLCLPVLLRILVDVLGGLHGLHGLRDGMNAQLNAFHGELSPRNVVVGRDGVARLVAVVRPRPIHLTPRSEAVAYAAPEIRDAHTPQDARADLYAVGVMLWEALTGRRLFESEDLAELAAKQRSEDLERPSLPATSPFAPLADVTMRALAFDPALRFRSASELASELRRVAGTRLAPGRAVAQTVAELAGERIRARRAELDPIASGTRRRASGSVAAAATAPPDAAKRELASPITREITLNGASLPDAPLVESTDGPRSGPPAIARAKPADPPRPPPADKGRYLVVPPRPARESVDAELLGVGEDATLAEPDGQPSAARVRSVSPPALALDEDIVVEPDFDAEDDEPTHVTDAPPHAAAAAEAPTHPASIRAAAKPPPPPKSTVAMWAAPTPKSPAAKPAQPQPGAASASLSPRTSPVEIPVLPPRESRGQPPGAAADDVPSRAASAAPVAGTDAPPILTALLRPPVLAMPSSAPPLDDDDDDGGPRAAAPMGPGVGVLPETPPAPPPSSAPVFDGGPHALAAPPDASDAGRRRRALYVVAAAMVVCALVSLIALASHYAPRPDAKRAGVVTASALPATEAVPPTAPVADPPPSTSATSAEGAAESAEAPPAGTRPPAPRETSPSAPRAEPAAAQGAEPSPGAQPPTAPSLAPKPAARPRKNSYEPLGI